MTALAGNVDEWEEVEPRRWQRKGHPEDGVVTLREGLAFADYFADRAEQRAPDADPRDEKIAALEARVAKLEEAEDSRKTLTTRN